MIPIINWDRKLIYLERLFHFFVLGLHLLQLLWLSVENKEEEINLIEESSTVYEQKKKSSNTFDDSCKELFCPARQKFQLDVILLEIDAGCSGCQVGLQGKGESPLPCHGQN